MTLHYANGELFVEQVPLGDIARRFGTPCYVYSSAALLDALGRYQRGLAPLDHLVCYAVKANANLAVLALLARAGSGFDVVSGGELFKVGRAGGDSGKVVFSGVGKRREEIEQALAAGIHSIDVESVAELRRISAVATQVGREAPVAIRVNPDVDAKTHPYIATGLRENKFGIEADQALEVCELAKGLPGIALRGLACHIGSQITELTPFREAITRMLALVDALASRGTVIRQLDLGGGVGIPYEGDIGLAIEDYCAMVTQLLGGRPLQVIVEPGRSIAGPMGTLLTRVEYTKRQGGRQFAIVDAAMTELLRPALYGANHGVLPVHKPAAGEPAQMWQLVGPVCETADFVARDRRLAIQEGALLAVTDAGAYGFSMSSNYNARPRVAEVLVAGERVALVRRRESLEALVADEVPVGDALGELGLGGG